MSVADKPLKIGFSAEELKKFEDYVKSPEGQAAITKTLNEIRETIAQMRKAREIPPYFLDKPMDF